MSTAYAMSLTRMEEGRRDGVERKRSARWIGRKIATRAGFTSLIRMQGQRTRVEIANPLHVQSWTPRQLDYAQLDYAECSEWCLFCELAQNLSCAFSSCLAKL